MEKEIEFVDINRIKVNTKRLLKKGDKFKYGRCIYEFDNYNYRGIIFAYEIKKGKRQKINNEEIAYKLTKCNENTDIEFNI